MKGILGKKLGMTEVFTDTGKVIPVTVIEVEPNVVTQVKTEATDGYNAVQLGIVDKKPIRSNKAEQGHSKKANTAPKRFLKEIRGIDISNYEIGQEVKADIFVNGEMVDVTGTSKGKGFQGVIKRHNQSIGPKSHGSHHKRRPGSMGPMSPMRVLPGKNLPGHMGHETVTIQNLEVVSIDLNENVILVKGNVPGIRGSLVIIKTAVKIPGTIKKTEELKSYVTEVEVSETEEVTEEVETTETKETPEVKEETNE